MTFFRFATILLLTNLIHCADSRPVVEVTVNGIEGIVTLEFIPTLNGTGILGAAPSRSANSDTPYQLRLPDGASGTLQLGISGRGPDACQLAWGESAAIPIDGPGPYPLAITLDHADMYQGCKLVITQVGNGAGQVSLSSASSGQPACDFSKEQPCLRRFSPGMVTLHAVPLNSSSQPSFFSGWGGACNGVADCTVEITPRSSRNSRDLLVDVKVGLLSPRECSPENVCWENPLPNGSRPRALWGASGEDIWLVGELGSIRHWDGLLFVPVTSGTTSQLNAVWGSGSKDVWAVGDGGTILHYDGVTWSTTASPGMDSLNGIWGSGSGDVWAVGDGGAILHYDGTSWTSAPSASLALLNAVWGSSSKDIWAVGEDGQILHYDGLTWQPRPAVINGSPISDSLLAVGGSSAKDVWVVGVQRTTDPAATVLHFTGTTWEEPATNLTFGNLTGVWVSAPGRLWAVGDSANFFYYDGKSWLAYHGPPSLGIWGSSESDVWAAGGFGYAARFNGVYWSQQGPSLFVSSSIHGVWGSGTGNNNLWAVSREGILRHNELGWSTAPTPPDEPAPLYGIWGSGPGNIWAVGDNGAILHYDGTTWDSYFGDGVSKPLKLTTQALKSIWGSSASDVLAVGTGGTLLYFDGMMWTALVGTGTTEDLRGVWSSGPDDIWVVGTAGTINHWDGVNWSASKSNTSLNLNGVWGSGPNDIWVVGDAGTILYGDGTSWDASDRLPTTNLRAVWGNGPTDLWIVGDYGRIFRSDTSGVYQELRRVTQNALFAVWGSQRSDAIMVGENGTILHHSP